MLIIGEQEAENNTVSVRQRGENGDIGTMNVEDFASLVGKAIEIELAVND